MRNTIPRNFQSIVGKTISSADETVCNLVTLTFTDGTVADIEAEYVGMFISPVIANSKGTENV